MPYITNSNMHSIIGKIDTRSVFLDGDIFDNKTFPYFNSLDKTILLATKKFFEDLSEFLKIQYTKVEKQIDTHSFVFEYEGYAPAYHKIDSCPRLLSDYKNFAIPPQIKIKGKEEIKRFREWFKTRGQHLIETNDQDFIDSLYANFNVQITKETLISLKENRPNSGNKEFENIQLVVLEKDIHKLIEKGEQYINENEKNSIIFNKYIKHTYKWNKPDLLFVDNANYSDKEIREILKTFEIDVKVPLKKKLEYYYQIKYNPEIEFKEDLLNQLGFVECSTCYSLPFNIEDFLK